MSHNLEIEMLKYTVVVWDCTAHEFLVKQELPTLGQATDRIRSLMHNLEYKTDLECGDVSMEIVIAKAE